VPGTSLRTPAAGSDVDGAPEAGALLAHAELAQAAAAAAEEEDADCGSADKSASSANERPGDDACQQHRNNRD